MRVTFLMYLHAAKISNVKCKLCLVDFKMSVKMQLSGPELESFGLEIANDTTVLHCGDVFSSKDTISSFC